MRPRNLLSIGLLLLVLLLVACSSPAPDCPEPAEAGLATIRGTEVTTLHSEVAGRDYQIYVALPDGYNPEAANPRKYPVVYLLDADFWFPVTAGVTRMLIPSEELQEIIVVSIGYTTDKMDAIFSRREWDLMPENSQGGGGGAADFLGFIQQELIPHIEATYSTDPADRTLAGHSYGGFFTLYALFHGTETFQRYLAMSPALWWDDRVAFEYEEAYAADHAELPVELFLSAGENEPEVEYKLWMVTNLKEFHEVMEARDYDGLEMELAVLEGTGHTSSFAGALSRGLLAVFH